jgi:small subunit ribosomal protein S6
MGIMTCAYCNLFTPSITAGVNRVHKEESMNKYEAIFIFRSEDESIAKGTATVVQEFKNAGINILETVDMGLRTLAYKIKKNEKGRYINYNIESSPEKLKPLEKLLRLKEEILKFVIFKKE